MGELYIVATPIGNLEDITLRAIKILRRVGLIAAEDTRKTRQLLNAHAISTPITSYHEHNKEEKLKYLLKRLEEEDVALVSEAGTPTLSDPGFELISAVLARSFKVVPIPGPSAIITALAASGLSTHQFTYLGFLPRHKGDRRRLLSSVSRETRTLVAFEAPHRLRVSLLDIQELLGNRRLAVCREMTKLHEEVFRGTAAEAASHFAEPRGEFTLVVEGATMASPQEAALSQAKQKVEELYHRGMGLKEAAECVATVTGISRRALYQACKELTRDQDRGIGVGDRCAEDV